MGAASPSPLPVSVLVVSRDNVLRNVVRMRLETAGYVMAEAAAVANATAYLHFADVPHIVVLDFQLPPRTVELLLYLVDVDAALQRHRYVLTVPSKPSKRLSDDLRKLIKTYCTAVTDKPFGLSLLEAIEVVAAQLPAPDSIV